MAPAVARVRALFGRVTLSAPDGFRRMLLGDGSQLAELPLGGTLDVGAGARADVSWSGVGNLLLHGPCRLDWTREGSSLTVRFERLHIAQAEMHEGGLVLELPGSWSIGPSTTPGSCAGATFTVSARGSALEVLHTGGRTLRLRSSGGRPHGTWPAFLRSGDRERLPGRS